MHIATRAGVVVTTLITILVATSLVDSGATTFASESGATAPSPAAAEPTTDGNKPEPWSEPVPENNDHGVTLSAMEYAEMIEPELGIPPVVDCGENVEIPIFVEGEAFQGKPEFHQCDNPSLQVGDCMSGGSVGRYPGVTADNEPMPDVVWISYCRHSSRATREQSPHKDSAQLIGYNRVTGATAFFEQGKTGDYTWTDPETNRMLGKLPGTDDPDAFNDAYTAPDKVQCVSCHQNDPFLHNPYIDSALLPGTNEPVIPTIWVRDMDPTTDVPYYIIGAKNHDLRTIHIEGNGCLNCHRIGMKTVELYMDNHWHPNDHMPPHKPGSLANDFAELVECWENTPEKTPGCDWIVPPAGKTAGRIVGDDYPHKALFNKADAFYYADLQKYREKKDED